MICSGLCGIRGFFFGSKHLADELLEFKLFPLSLLAFVDQLLLLSLEISLIFFCMDMGDCVLLILLNNFNHLIVTSTSMVHIITVVYRND